MREDRMALKRTAKVSWIVLVLLASVYTALSIIAVWNGEERLVDTANILAGLAVAVGIASVLMTVVAYVD